MPWCWFLGTQNARAPQKQLIMVPHAGHDPNPDMIAAQYKILKERILPLAQ